MAMALRSVLGKLGNKCIQKNRSVMMARAFSSLAINNKHDAVPISFTGHFFRHPQDCGSHETKQKRFDYYMDLGGLEPTRFAVEEFNKRKNAQLQLVRVVKAQRHVLPSGDDIFIETFKAADDAGVVKVYQAKVPVNCTDGMWLEWFCLVGDDGSHSTLFDHLENFFENDYLIHTCKKQGFISCIDLVIQTIYGSLNDHMVLIRVAHWVLEAFNKQKNTQLQFVRVVRASVEEFSYDNKVYFITLEAVDDGAVKAYQAKALVSQLRRYGEPDRLVTSIGLFGLVDDDGSLLKLIDNRNRKWCKDVRLYFCYGANVCTADHGKNARVVQTMQSNFVKYALPGRR